MKQLSITTTFIFTASVLIILAIAGLTTCVQWNIGGYMPLVIVLCTLGALMLMAYTTKVDHEEVQFDALLALAFTIEAEQHPYDRVNFSSTFHSEDDSQEPYSSESMEYEF